MERKIREIRFDGNIAYVPLMRGYVATIDAADASEIGRWDWYANVQPYTVYAVRNAKLGSKWMTIRMHREIMSPPDDLYVDHINRDGLDNRRSNLRIATESQNNHNQRLRFDNTSGVKGVSFYQNRKQWRAYIMMNNKQFHLGFFATIEAAAAAVAVARADLHGEFGSAA